MTNDNVYFVCVRQIKFHLYHTSICVDRLNSIYNKLLCVSDRSNSIYVMETQFQLCYTDQIPSYVMQANLYVCQLDQTTFIACTQTSICDSKIKITFMLPRQLYLCQTYQIQFMPQPQRQTYFKTYQLLHIYYTVPLVPDSNLDSNQNRHNLWFTFTSGL